MKEDYTEITDRMSATLDGSITNSIHNFANKTLQLSAFDKNLIKFTIL